MASRIIGSVVLVMLCAGCAGLAPDQGEDKQEKVYRTGSNLPQKDRAGVVTVDPGTVQDALRSRPGVPNTGR